MAGDDARCSRWSVLAQLDLAPHQLKLHLVVSLFVPNGLWRVPSSLRLVVLVVATSPVLITVVHAVAR